MHIAATDIYLLPCDNNSFFAAKRLEEQLSCRVAKENRPLRYRMCVNIYPLRNSKRVSPTRFKKSSY